MDILKTAGIRAGRNFSAFKVTLPLVYAMAMAFFGAITVGYLGYSEYAQWLILLAGCFLVLNPVVSTIAYFLARKNPKLIRQELEDLIECEQMIVEKSEKFLIKESQELENILQGYEASFERKWREGYQRGKNEALRMLQETLDALREANQQASAAERIRNQEYFILVHRAFSDCDVALEQMRNYDPLANEKNQGRFQSAKEQVLSKIKQINTEFIEEWQEKIAESKRMIAEARSALQEFTL